MASLLVAFIGGMLDGTVHRFDLTTRQMMVGLGESVLDTVFMTYLVKVMVTVTRVPANTILRQIDKLDAPFDCLPAAVD